MEIEGIARELLDALDHGRTVGSVAERHPGFGTSEAYRVAREIVRLRRARGERTVGRKIGFTYEGIWAEYGATAPIWAHVYDRTLIRAGDGRATLSLWSAVRPRIEPEIAFRLARPLAAGVDDPIRILEAVEWVAASFEIVDCHFADWKFRAPDSVADFALHWRLVVGPPHLVAGRKFRDRFRGPIRTVRSTRPGGRAPRSGHQALFHVQRHSGNRSPEVPSVVRRNRPSSGRGSASSPPTLPVQLPGVPPCLRSHLRPGGSSAESARLRVGRRLTRACSCQPTALFNQRGSLLASGLGAFALPVSAVGCS